jgi:hypothetical protein
MNEDMMAAGVTMVDGALSWQNASMLLLERALLGNEDCLDPRQEW